MKPTLLGLNKSKRFSAFLDNNPIGYYDDGKCTLFANDESKYSHGKNPPICALPKQEMNERSYRKIAEKVRKKHI